MQVVPGSLDDVIATHLLDQRRSRVRSREAEARAMAGLKQALAGSPRSVLQKLAEVAIELCNAQSAGVSLPEEVEARQVFRWHAVAGGFGHLLFATLPRDGSPCGTVVERAEALLMIEPERYYAPLRQITPRVTEALLVPFEYGGEMAGTVWVATHEPGRQFDAHDRRIMSELAQFAAEAYARLRSFKAEDIRDLSRMHLAPQPGWKGPGEK
jgi:GAF domain-containing protein